MATPSRTAKNITNPKDIEYIINIKEEDITTTFISEMFGEFESGQRFHPYDTITIPANSYGPKEKRNKKSLSKSAF